MATTDTDRTAFDAWLAAVDNALEARCGLTSLDLADVSYYDWYEDGFTPVQAARLALSEQ